MRQAFHVFRKDLRRAWPLLLLWAAALLLLSQPLRLDPLDAVDAFPNQGLTQALMLAHAAALAAALVIQEDSPIGQSELWMTQPIPALSLLGAKLAFIGLFVLLPVVSVQVASLASHGYPQQRWAWQFLDLALPWSAYLAVASLLGSLTKGLAGFHCAFLGLLFAVLSAPAVKSSLEMPSGFVSTLGLTAAVLLVAHYWTRRRARVALCGLAAPLLAWIYPIDYRFDRDDSVGEALGALHVELTAGPGRERLAVTTSLEGPFERVAIRVAPRFDDGPSDWRIHFQAHGDVEWLDGSASPFYVGGAWSVLGEREPEPDLRWAVAPRTDWQDLVIGGGETAESLLGRRGAIHAGARASVLEAKKLSVPLRPAAEAHRDGFAVRVLEVRRELDDLKLLVRVRSIRSRSSVELGPLAYLVNRSRGEAIPLRREEQGRGFFAAILVLVGGAMPGAG